MCSVELLKPGMVLEENIYDLERVLILSSGTVLSTEFIKTIARLGYTEVNVQSAPDLQGKVNNRLGNAKIRAFQDIYNKMENQVSDLIKYISDGNKVDMEQVHNISNALVETMGGTRDVFTYLNQVRLLDDHTMGHSINVSLICGVICDWINVNNDLKRDVIAAGMLHDIGKSLIPQNILKKPGPLSPQEWKQIQQHPVNGYQILKQANAPNPVLIGTLMHHERGDGNGYPLGLKQEKIPLVAKIVAIADIYDAMTSDRSYRSKLCPFHVIKQFQYNYFGVLDTKILMTFLTRIAECYIGEMVFLNDGTTGEIIYIPKADPARPIVKTEFGLINLQDRPDLDVQYIITNH